MSEQHLDLDAYLEMLQESYETLRESQIGDVTEIPEYAVEKRCAEAVDKHDEIGAIENPQLNAGVVALALTGEDALDDTPPESGHESGAEYLADVAHATAKYDLISWVLDRQVEAEREGDGDGAQEAKNS